MKDSSLATSLFSFFTVWIRAFFSATSLFWSSRTCFVFSFASFTSMTKFSILRSKVLTWFLCCEAWVLSWPASASKTATLEKKTDKVRQSE